MLSIVISTKKPENLKRVLKSIEQTAILKNQLIIYENPRGRGLCVVYNECAVKASNGLLCFVHDDMVFHTKGWDQIIVNLLQQETVGLVGVIGGRYKSLFGTSWRDGETTSYRMQVKDGVEGGKLLVNNPSNKKYDEVVCLDGAFLACTKKHWQQFPFDENRFNDFHFYDLDISLQMHTAGLKNLVTYDILLEHFSQGKQSRVYLNEFLKFQQKWKAHLPLSVDDDTKEKESQWNGYALAETLALMKRLSFPGRERWKQLRHYHALYKNWYHVLRSFYFGFLK